MPSFNEISPAQLMRLLGTPSAPVVLDLRLPEDFAQDPALVPTARRAAHDALGPLLPELAGARVVCICHRGHKVSHGAAALLRAFGIAAEALGGGATAWRAAGLPMVPWDAIPEPRRGTLWVTRHRPRIDRIACPWLIRRFVDPWATFLFVPPAEVMGVAERFGATPFDIEGVALSHDGPACTFDAVIARFGLAHGALDALATVVRAADTDRHELAPQAAGLLAISVGLSRAHRDDLAQLEAGAILYDALYRWARDGRDEGHDWPADRAA
jgi:rhodanese-related sulfurtransferase